MTLPDILPDRVGAIEPKPWVCSFSEKPKRPFARTSNPLLSAKLKTLQLKILGRTKGCPDPRSHPSAHSVLILKFKRIWIILYIHPKQEKKDRGIPMQTTVLPSLPSLISDLQRVVQNNLNFCLNHHHHHTLYWFCLIISMQSLWRCLFTCWNDWVLGSWEDWARSHRGPGSNCRWDRLPEGGGRRCPWTLTRRSGRASRSVPGSRTGK